MTTDPSRRRLLALAAAAPAALIGANAPHAEPEALRAEFAYEAIVALGPTEEIGQAPYGRCIQS
jgi:hypothetical protein